MSTFEVTKAIDDNTILDVDGLTVRFVRKTGLFRRAYLHAVNDVSFSLGAGETLGIVGESGCGKSTLARAIIGLVGADLGRIRYRGTVLFEARANGKPTSRRQRRKLAMRKNIQFIFQDPFASLNPRMSVGDALLEPIRIHGLHFKSASKRVDELLTQVGLSSRYRNRYPKALSGGQRQRVGIARALATEPELLICDESVSALDVSVQAQIINLLADLRDSMGLSMIFITHDLSVVRYFCDRTLVMYLGKIVEHGPTDSLFSSSRHRYTRALIGSMTAIGKDRIADGDPDSGNLQIEGEVPSPTDLPPGCYFASRCPKKVDLCLTDYPQMERRGDLSYACHNPTENSVN